MHSALAGTAAISRDNSRVYVSTSSGICVFEFDPIEVREVACVVSMTTMVVLGFVVCCHTYDCYWTLPSSADGRR